MPLLFPQLWMCSVFTCGDGLPKWKHTLLQLLVIHPTSLLQVFREGPGLVIHLPQRKWLSKNDAYLLHTPKKSCHYWYVLIAETMIVDSPGDLRGPNFRQARIIRITITRTYESLQIFWKNCQDFGFSRCWRNSVSFFRCFSWSLRCIIHLYTWTWH